MSKLKVENSEQNSRNSRIRSKNYRSRGVYARIHNNDALDVLCKTPALSADVVFLDPPFNLNKEYNSSKVNDSISNENYCDWLNNVVKESARILKQGGAFYLYHIPSWAIKVPAMLDGMLEFRNWISISMKNGFVIKNRLYPAHYSLLYYTKGMPNVFNRPKLDPERCRHCGKLIKDYGGYKHIIENNGVNLSDVWTDIYPVRHAKYKNRRANELNPKIYQRILQMSSIEGGTYVEPFMGTGTGVVTAAEFGMRIVASDISKESFELTCDRIIKLQKEYCCG